jgi:hypothetical protein
MDADDLSEMKRFEKQIELMERDNGDICGCHFTIISETNKIVNSFIAPITKKLFHVVYLIQFLMRMALLCLENLSLIK